QGLDGEVGIFRASEHEEGIGATGCQQEEEEQGDGPLANRDCGKIEAHQLTSLPWAVLTRAPSLRRSAPSETTGSSELSPEITAVSLVTRTSLTGRKCTVELA